MKMTRHTPVTEQLYGFPIPIYVEINPAISASVGKVWLFYRVPGEVNFQKKEMTKLAGMEAYGTKIECDFVINPPSYEYYIMVATKDGSPLAFEPKEGMQNPFVVKYVQMLAGTPPTMGPMSPPEQKCKTNPDICFSDAECLPGFKCFESMCVVDESAKKGKKGRGGPGGMGFISIDPMFAFGFGVVKDNAYYSAPKDANGNPVYIAESALKSPGFAMSGPALRLSAAGGYFLKGNFAIGAGFYFRYQFMAGNIKNDADPQLDDSKKDNFSAGGKLVFLVTALPNKKLNQDSLWVQIGLGGGYSRMRHQISNVDHPICKIDPNNPACSKVTFWRLAGNTGILLPEILISYRFLKFMGVVFGVSSELIVYDRFAWNLDINLGLQFSFEIGKGKKKAEEVSAPPEEF